MTSLVVLSKYATIFHGFNVSVMQRWIRCTEKIVVRDGKQVKPPEDWVVVEGLKPFSMAGNANLGLRKADPGNDILYCGDDIRFTEARTLENLRRAAYSDERIGLVCPIIHGRSSGSQSGVPSGQVKFINPMDFWFPCVYFKRSTIERVGYLDEQFNGFGSDDLDYCIRVVKAGLKLAVTGDTSVVHLASPQGGPTTFERNGLEYKQQQAAAFEKLCAKWHVTLGEMYSCMSNNNYAQCQ